MKRKNIIYGYDILEMTVLFTSRFIEAKEITV